MIGDCQESCVVARSPGALPEDLSTFDFQAEEASATVMRETVEQITVHNCRTHVERDLFLKPQLLDFPGSVFLLRLQADHAPVLSTQEDAILVEGGRWHVLVGAHVWKGIFPQRTTARTFDTDQSPVIPLDDLSDAVDFNQQW